MAWTKEKKREYQKQWQKNNPDYMRNYYKRTHIIKPKLTSEEKKLKQYKYHRKYRLRHKDRIKARSIITVLITAGKLIPQPCETCGSTEKIQAHHDDYTKPLDIRWLCQKHHILEHTRLKDNLKIGVSDGI